MANKENIGECPPPKKKHRLSLSLKHKPLVPQQEIRFAEPVSEYEVKLASKGVVPDNTKRETTNGRQEILQIGREPDRRKLRVIQSHRIY